MKKLILLIAACAAVSFAASAQKLNISGTWKLIESQGKTLPENYSQIKLITPTHFMWALYDKDGNIIDGAGGAYTIKGDKYTESIDYVLPLMRAVYKNKPVFEIQVNGNKLTQKGKVGDTELTEVWERID